MKGGFGKDITVCLVALYPGDSYSGISPFFFDSQALFFSFLFFSWTYSLPILEEIFGFRLLNELLLGRATRSIEIDKQAGQSGISARPETDLYKRKMRGHEAAASHALKILIDN